MVINKIDITDNYDKLKNDPEILFMVGSDVIDDFYIEIANICFNRYIGEDFGTVIEHIATTIRSEDEEDQYGNGYMLIYRYTDVIQKLWSTIKHHGNGMFRGGNYDDNIYLSVELIQGRMYLIYNTENPLYNKAIFANVAYEEPDLVIELETEYTIFKMYFQNTLFSSYSHNSTNPHDNDYYPMFIGIVELLIFYGLDRPFEHHKDITTDLDQLFLDIIEIVDENDSEILGTFFLNNSEYIHKLTTYLKNKIGSSADLVSWGVIGDKVLIGLKRR